MGTRSIQRQVAKGRMAAMGTGNINKKLDGVKAGVPNWKRVLYGDYAKSALAAQLGAGVRSRRKLKKIEK